MFFFYRDAILVPLLNCLTSFFAGFVIFSYLGYLAHVTNQDISNIVQAGKDISTRTNTSVDKQTLSSIF